MHGPATTIRPFTVTHRAVLVIAVPAALALITEPLVGMVDTILIGRLGDAALLGGVALGAVAFDMLFAAFFFLRLGTAGLVAQAVGSDDPAAAAAHLLRALLIALVSGLAILALGWPITEGMARILAADGAVGAAFRSYFSIRLWTMPLVLVNFSIAGWLYGRGDARSAFGLALATNGVNAAVSAGLVLGAGLGVAGVAWGTVAAQAVATAGGLVLVSRHYRGFAGLLALVPRGSLMSMAPVRRLMSLSASLIIRSVALMSTFAYFSAQGSRAGATVLAANAILLNFFAISTFFLDGLSTAAEQLSGKAVGAGYRPAFRRARRLSLIWGAAVAGTLSLGMWIFGSAIIDFMTTAEDVRAAAKGMLVFAALTPLTGMPAFIADGVVIGATMAKDLRNGMVAASAMFFATAFVLQPIWGIAGLWVSLHLLFVYRTAILFWLVHRREPVLFPVAAAT